MTIGRLTEDVAASVGTGYSDPEFPNPMGRDVGRNPGQDRVRHSPIPILAGSGSSFVNREFRSTEFFRLFLNFSNFVP